MTARRKSARHQRAAAKRWGKQLWTNARGQTAVVSVAEYQRRAAASERLRAAHAAGVFERDRDTGRIKRRWTPPGGGGPLPPPPPPPPDREIIGPRDVETTADLGELVTAVYDAIDARGWRAEVVVAEIDAEAGDDHQEITVVIDPQRRWVAELVRILYLLGAGKPPRAGEPGQPLVVPYKDAPADKRARKKTKVGPVPTDFLRPALVTITLRAER